MSTEIINADILEWAASYKGPKFHSMMCDPPYHLTSGNAIYDLPLTGSGNPRVKRASKGGGFMGKTWDGGDIAFQPATWAALSQHLHPGAFCMAFASSRGWHRMACAIEDGGFVFHPSIGMLGGWAFGSGFPKATRIPDAPEFSVHRYGLQALKPAFEPIVVFQKPYEGKPVDSIRDTGAGAINVDAGRIGTAESTGRWPANLVLVHLPSCQLAGTKKVASTPAHPVISKAPREGFQMTQKGEVVNYGDANGEETVDAWVCGEGCPVAAFDQQAGPLSSGFMAAGQEKEGNGYHGGLGKTVSNDTHGDEGGASRFFLQAGWEAEIYERLHLTNPVYYEPKAGRDERDAGLSGEKKPLLWSSGTKSPGTFQSDGTDRSAKNPHPTVKPMALCKHLASLLMPPLKYAPRRLLIPFSGSGSECVAAEMAGWEEVVGIEGSDEYADIARQRIAFWISTIQLKLF